MGIFGFGSRSGGVDYMVVGLGNPGAEYEKTRHNAGFLALDFVLEKREKKADRLKFSALTAKMNHNGKGVLYIKPQTYMNLSGKAVSAAANYYKIPPEKIIVISDDVSLECGALRIRKQGSHGGHKGLKSIGESIGSFDFPRIKLGVGDRPNPEYDMADWVLSKFTPDDYEKISANFDKVYYAIEYIIKGETERAMNLLNH